VLVHGPGGAEDRSFDLQDSTGAKEIPNGCQYLGAPFQERKGSAWKRVLATKAAIKIS
jgi:hypothetical protein